MTAFYLMKSLPIWSKLIKLDRQSHSESIECNLLTVCSNQWKEITKRVNGLNIHIYQKKQQSQLNSFFFALTTYGYKKRHTGKYQKQEQFKSWFEYFTQCILILFLSGKARNVWEIVETFIVSIHIFKMRENLYLM